MFIKNMFKNKNLTVSFEVFPPKNDQSLDNIYKTIDELKNLNPDFISVTYGAGGSSKDRTIEIAATIKKKYSIESIAHLTCITSTRNEINSILGQLKRNDIQNILALRGDLPIGFKIKEDIQYRYAKELVGEIASKQEFSIAAAAYPEGHIESKNIEEDIRNLKEKINNGVDYLITQLFFDNTNFYKFREKLYENNINIPIVVGIMPVLNKNQIERIVALSGATIPEKFRKILNKYEHSPEALREAGIAYATEQIIDLITNEVQGVHLYTMNKYEAIKEIVGNIKQLRKTVNV